MKRKLLIFVLSVIAVVCCAVALSACGEKDGGNTHPPTEGLAYEYDSETNSYVCTGMGTAIAADIVIASQIDGKPVTSIGERAFDECTSLKSITIPASITSIGEDAFKGCTSLESVTFLELEGWNIDVSNPTQNADNLKAGSSYYRN